MGEAPPFIIKDGFKPSGRRYYCQIVINTAKYEKTHVNMDRKTKNKTACRAMSPRQIILARCLKYQKWRCRNAGPDEIEY